MAKTLLKRIEMRPPSTLEFIIANGLSEDQVNNANYKIYAHAFKKLVYVGRAIDPVRRWEDHYNEAHNEFSYRFESEFGYLIRNSASKIKHYIVAVASNDKDAKDLEYAAIGYYGNLNQVRPQYWNEQIESFAPLEKANGKKITLSKQSLLGAWKSRTDEDRDWVLCEIVYSRRRKRVISLPNQLYPEGLFVECSKAERAIYGIGDRVWLPVAGSKKSTAGTDYLVAPKTARFVPA